MKKNESNIDRLIRAILGVAVIYLVFHFGLVGFWAILGYVVGLLLLFTAATGYCYLYTALGIGSKKE